VPLPPFAPIATTCSELTPAGTVKVCSAPVNPKVWVAAAAGAADAANAAQASQGTRAPLPNRRSLLAVLATATAYSAHQPQVDLFRELSLLIAWSTPPPSEINGRRP